MDARVSGGVVGAEAATLTFMAGAERRSSPRPNRCSRSWARGPCTVEEAGAGQAAKICNNMILGISMIAVSEAFVLGENLSLSHRALYDVASTASGRCWALTTNCPVPGTPAHSSQP
ncbi:NAD-binding protein [Streptomyces anulatus]|uniref:NAD-binding protein n=1 Tax=Streptomyces anulatus TaxID=1892 RepID=UPI00365C2F11